MPNLKPVANFLFEAGNLSKTPRSFHPLLGSGSQTVAEHINRTCYVGLALANLHGGVNAGKVVVESILATDSDEWWFGDKADEWWVSRTKPPS